MADVKSDYKDKADGRLKLIIAGSRPAKMIRLNPLMMEQWYKRHEQERLIWQALDESPFRFFEIGEVVEGEAAGVDTLAKRWANREGLEVKAFPALWQLADGSVDKAAGFRRNEQMANYADALLAIWDGESRGTRHMIERMMVMGKRFYVAMLL